MRSIIFVDALIAKIGTEKHYSDIYHYINLLPDFIRRDIYNYRKRETVLQSTFGKLLLMIYLQELNGNTEMINSMSYNKFGCPQIKGVSFNISHSGEYVICAVCSNEEIKIGVDIELIDNINIEDYIDCMNYRDKLFVYNSRYHKSYNFYKLWTAKESTIKAEKQSLDILKEVIIEERTSSYKKNKWNIDYIDIDSRYICCLASNKVVPVRKRFVNFDFAALVHLFNNDTREITSQIFI